MLSSRKVIIIAPHPDDEVLGCGGLIRKLTLNGAIVWVLVVSRGKPGMYLEEQIRNVRSEAITAHKILGIDQTRFLEFPAPELDTISISELSRAISIVISEFKPDTVLLPHRGDLHHDHRAVFSAGLVASRPVAGCSVRNIFSYETLSETEWAAPFGDEVFKPDFFVNISNTINEKKEAMKCYRSQLKDFPNPRSLKAIENLANLRGSTVGFQYAESFMTIRIIID